MWKHIPFFPSSDGTALTAALKPSALSGTTTKFSSLSWADRFLGQDPRSHAKNALVSLTPEIKIGVLLMPPLRGVCCWPLGRWEWCY